MANEYVKDFNVLDKGIATVNKSVEELSELLTGLDGTQIKTIKMQFDSLAESVKTLSDSMTILDNYKEFIDIKSIDSTNAAITDTVKLIDQLKINLNDVKETGSTDIGSMAGKSQELSENAKTLGSVSDNTKYASLSDDQKEAHNKKMQQDAANKKEEIASAEKQSKLLENIADKELADTIKKVKHKKTVLEKANEDLKRITLKAEAGTPKTQQKLDSDVTAAKKKVENAQSGVARAENEVVKKTKAAEVASPERLAAAKKAELKKIQDEADKAADLATQNAVKKQKELDEAVQAAAKKGIEAKKASSTKQPQADKAYAEAENKVAKLYKEAADLENQAKLKQKEANNATPERAATVEKAKNAKEAAAILKRAADEEKALITNKVKHEISEIERVKSEKAKAAKESRNAVLKSAGDFTSEANKIGTASYQLGMQAANVLKLREAFSALKNVVKQVVDYSKQIENTTVQFDLKLKNEESTEEFMKELRDFSNATPLMLTDVSNAANLLSNYGIAMDEVIGKVKQIGDVSRGQADNMNRIALAVGQIQSKGKLMAEETRQLTEAGVPIRKALQDTMDVTGMELDKMFKRGQVTIDMFWKAFDGLTKEGGQFNGVLARMSQTTGGLESTLKDTLLSLGTELGATGLEEYRTILADILVQIGKFKKSSEFKELSDEIGKVTAEIFIGVENVISMLMNNTDIIINAIEKIKGIIEYIINNPMKVLAMVLLPTIVGMAANLLSIVIGLGKSALALKGIFTALTATAGFTALATKIAALAAAFGPVVLAIGAVVAAIAIATKAFKDHHDAVKRMENDYEGKLGAASNDTYTQMNAKASNDGAKVSKEFEVQFKKDLELAKKARADMDEVAAEYDKLMEERSELNKKVNSGAALTLEETTRLSTIDDDIKIKDEELTAFSDSLDAFFDVLMLKSKDGVKMIDYIRQIDRNALESLSALLLGVNDTTKKRQELLGEAANELYNSGESSADDIIKELQKRDEAKRVVKVTTSEMRGLYLGNEIDAGRGIKEGSLVSNDDALKNKQFLKNSIEASRLNEGVFTTEGEKQAKKDAEAFTEAYKKEYTRVVDAAEDGLPTFGKKETKLEDRNTEELERIKKYMNDLESAILLPSGDNKKKIEAFKVEEENINKYIELQSKLKKSQQEIADALTEGTTEYTEASAQIRFFDANITAASAQLDNGYKSLVTYSNTLKTLANNAKTAKIAMIDFSDEAVGAAHLEILNDLGIKPGQILADVDKMKIAVNSLLAPFKPNSEQMSGLTKSVDAFGKQLMRSGLNEDKLQSSAYTGLNKIVENFFKSSGFQFDSEDIARTVSQLYSGVFENYVNKAQDNTTKSIEKFKQAGEDAKQAKAELYSNKMSDYNYNIEIGTLKTLNEQLEKLKEIRKYAYSIEDIRQSDLDIMNKQKEILSEQLNTANTIYDVNKASRDAMNSYSQSWIEHSIYTKAIDDIGILDAHQRVFDRKQLNIADQLLQKQKQIALVRQNASMSELERMSAISAINNDIRSMNAEILQNQDELAKKREEVYKKTLYEEIQKLYDYEVGRIDEVVKARNKNKEDKSFEERKKEIEEEISLYASSVSKEGQIKLDELRKELKTLEESYSDTLFGRQVEDEKKLLEERKTLEEKAADNAAFKFGQSYGQALNTELDIGLEKVRASFGSGSDVFVSGLSGYFKTNFINDLVNGINSAFKNINGLVNNKSNSVVDNRSQVNNYNNTNYTTNNSSAEKFFDIRKGYGNR